LKAVLSKASDQSRGSLNSCGFFSSHERSFQDALATILLQISRTEAESVGVGINYGFYLVEDVCAKFP